MRVRPTAFVKRNNSCNFPIRSHRQSSRRHRRRPRYGPRDGARAGRSGRRSAAASTAMRTVRRRRRPDWRLWSPGRGRPLRRVRAGADPQLVRKLDPEFGRIDFLGNVAGEGVLGSPEEISLEDVEQRRGATWSSAASACVRKRAGGCWRPERGSIVNIGSLASITALGRGHIAYSMAMGAVVQMTRELSTEWSGRGRARQRDPAGAGRQSGPGDAHGRRSQRSKPDFSAAFRPAGSASRTTSKASPCFWRPTRRAGSPARSSRWTAATWRMNGGGLRAAATVMRKGEPSNAHDQTTDALVVSRDAAHPAVRKSSWRAAISAG